MPLFLFSTAMGSNKYAILIDGGFFTKIFASPNKHYPSASDVEIIVSRIQKLHELNNRELLRIFYYDAPPLQSKVTNPLDKHAIDLGQSDLAKNSRKLHSELVMRSDFALRMGELKINSWILKPSVFKRCGRTPEATIEEKEDNAKTTSSLETTIEDPPSLVIYPKDLRPEINQKGVDLKIGMDIACMAIRQTVDTIVMITGDSDLVPALKLARREGLRVYCVQFKERKLTDVLIIHSDKVLEVSIHLDSPLEI